MKNKMLYLYIAIAIIIFVIVFICIIAFINNTDHYQEAYDIAYNALLEQCKTNEDKEMMRLSVTFMGYDFLVDTFSSEFCKVLNTNEKSAIVREKMTKGVIDGVKAAIYEIVSN